MMQEQTDRGDACSQDSVVCLLKTRSENYKEYRLILGEGELIFSRPGSTKLQQLIYQYSEF